MQQTSADLSTEELDTLKNLVKGYFHSTAQPIFSFLSGSITEGISTPNSDYDIYAVFDNCTEEEVLISELDRPVELTKISLAKIHSIMEFISKGENLASVGAYEMLICHRVYSGIALSGESVFDSIKKEFDVTTFRTRLADLSLLNAERELKVSQGFKLVNDLRSALFSAHKALRHSLSVLLAIRGSTSVLEKWHVRYAVRYLGEHHPGFRRFLELASSIPVSSTVESKKYLISVKKFHQMITDYKIIADIVPEEIFFVESRLVDTDQLSDEPLILKNPDARVMFHMSKWYLTIESKAILELPSSAALFWALIDNAQSVDMIIDRAKEHLKITDNVCLEYLDALAAAKAISSHSFEIPKSHRAI